MSDEGKKRDRALQRRVRERQEKTGESYQDAWRHVATEAVTKGTGLTDVEKSERTIEALDEFMSTLHRAHRIPLPMSSGVPILPEQSVQITARPQLQSFWPERFLIKNADHWDIHKLVVGMSAHLIEPGTRKASEFALDVWQPLMPQEARCAQDIVLVATYAGSNAEGEPLEAVLFGWEEKPPTTPTNAMKAPERREERVTIREESAAIKPSRTLALHLMYEPVMTTLINTSPALFVDRLVIADAENWIVHDIKVSHFRESNDEGYLRESDDGGYYTFGNSIFVQAGDVPGELFADSRRVILEPLGAKSRVEIMATYIGTKPSSHLVVELSGTTTQTNVDELRTYFLPLSTNALVEPTQSAQITARPQMHFIADRLVISDADNWVINNLMIGMKCQFAQSGDIPAQAFARNAVGCEVAFDRMHVAMDVVLVTTRVGDKRAAFYGAVQGHLAPSRDHSALRGP